MLATVLRPCAALEQGKLYPYRIHFISGVIYYQLLLDDPFGDPIFPAAMVMTVQSPEGPAAD